MGWEVSPNGLFDLMRRLRDDYAPPAIIVTENGAAFGDARAHDGSVRDPERRDYLASHVDALGRAIAAGVPVEGYFAWSLLDNFEWAHGYARRFGLVYVDFPTLERDPEVELLLVPRPHRSCDLGRPCRGVRCRSPCIRAPCSQLRRGQRRLSSMPVDREQGARATWLAALPR